MDVSRSGIVEVEYSHFSIGEMRDPGFDAVEARVDFATSDPVIAVPGQSVIVSRVQAHGAPVALSSAAPGQETVPGGDWRLVSTISYAPVYSGRMYACDTMNGVASPAPGPIEAFGQSIEPGEPATDLDLSHVCRVQIWARGREDSRERHEEAMEREVWGAHEGFEEYAVVFTPAGEQEASVPSGEVGLRERFARQRAEEDEIARLFGRE
ncbi:hypothetical protein ACH4VM_29420 [Streptomyces sp. NPDC020792]|uniref:hypothetical protein n=1 Tax=Streptomyces sp. NPDC020792 TaxID=3365089 RepID=UPI0037A7E4D6